MPFAIRPVTASDMEAITAIYREAVLHGTASFELDPPDGLEMRARMEAITGAGYPYVVACDDADGALLGYAYAGAYRARPAYRWTVENSVYVDKDAQGRGIGKALTDEIIARCTTLGFRQMIAVIGGADHRASIAMHEALGFAHVGLLPATGFKHGRWLASVLMQRALGDGDSSEPDPSTYPGTLYRGQ